MASPNYSNDAHREIAYLLVFHSIPLQERLCLRIICRRWKNIIEEDTARMTTLRVFGTKDSLRRYIDRIGACEGKAPTADAPRYDVSPWNSIILSAPRFSRRNDISFLSRLFPLLHNLAIDLAVGEEEEEKKPAQPVAKRIKLNRYGSEPNVFQLLRFWAPHLKSLYLATGKLCKDYRGDIAYTLLGPKKSKQFWDCLHLMRSTITTLTFTGVSLQTVPESLVLPLVTSLGYIHMNDTFSDHQTEALTVFKSPELLQNLAPALQTLRLPTEADFGDWQLPSSVTTLSIALSAIYLGSSFRPSPGITHLEIEPIPMELVNEKINAFRNWLPLLPEKFPSLNSLKIVELRDFLSWMLEINENIKEDIGEDIADVKAFSGYLARKPSTPLDTLTELHLGNASDLSDLLAKYAPYWDALFRGLAFTFKGLRKLVWSVGPAKEADHKFYLEKCTAYGRQYLPKVELTFVLDIAVGLKMAAFQDGPLIASGCHLSSGCVLSPEP